MSAKTGVIRPTDAATGVGSFISCLCSGFGTSFVAMGHVSVLAQLYVLTPWVLWFLHSFQLPTCVPLLDRLSPCCLPEASLFGPPPCFFRDWSLPKRVMIAGMFVLSSPTLLFALSVAPPLVPSSPLSLTLSVTLFLTLSFRVYISLRNWAAIKSSIVVLAIVVLYFFYPSCKCRYHYQFGCSVDFPISVLEFALPRLYFLTKLG